MRTFMAAVAFLAFAACPAIGADTTLKASVEIVIGDFLDSYRAYLFYDAMNPGSRADMRGDLYADLDIQLDPNLRTQGKYWPSVARVPRGFKNHLLVVQTINLSELPVSLWHEAVHHRIRLQGGEECGPEEAYMDLQESRISWLNLLIKFEEQFKAAMPTDAKACESLVKRWDFLEKKWKGDGRQNLGGPYEWQDTDDATCERNKMFHIDRSFVQRWDAKLGIRADFGKVRDIYAWKVDRCREFLASAGTQQEGSPAETAVVSIDDLLQKMRDAAGQAASIEAEARQKASRLQTAAGQPVEGTEQNLQGLQNMVAGLTGSAATIGQLLGQVAESAGRIQATCNRVATARDVTMKKALEACSSAETLKNTTDAAERSRLLPIIQSAATQAEANARIVNGEWNSASQALAGLKQSVDLVAQFSDLLRESHVEWNRLSSELAPLQDAAAAGQSAITEVRSLSDKLQAITNESAGYLQEGVRRLSAHTDPQKAAGLRKDLETLHAQVLSHANAVGPLATGMENQLHAFSKRIDSISASLQSISGVLTGIAEPQWDASRIAEASAWVDAAELFVEPSNTAAANARKCAGAAASIPQATPVTGGSGPMPEQPASDPDWDTQVAQGTTTTETSGNADWDSAAASATTTSSSRVDPTPPPPPPPPPPAPAQQPPPQPAQPAQNREWATDLAKTLVDLQNTLIQSRNKQGRPAPPTGSPTPAPSSPQNPQNPNDPCAPICAISGGKYGSQVNLLFERTIRGGCKITKLYDVFSVDDDPKTRVNEVDQFIATWKQASPGATTILLGRNYRSFDAAANAARAKCPHPQFIKIQ